MKKSDGLTKTERIEKERAEIKKAYNEVFNGILACEKMSDRHRRLLHIERKLYFRSALFFRRNAHYFSTKRKEIMSRMEGCGMFGTRPSWEQARPIHDGRSNNKFWEENYV